jgi:ribosomal protein S12 methylthiotransferase accessory factor
LAFYSLQQPPPVFVIEGSNGCAVGNSPEEAILHGLFEVIERDSLLLTWYARASRPQIDPMEADDPEIRCRYRRLQLEGFDVLALDVTTQFGIPAVWVTARRRGPKLPYAVCAGAAHVRAERALRKALRELDATLNRFSLDISDPGLRRRAFELGEDPQRVRTMLDHGLFYTVPLAGSHLDFLWETSERRSLADLNASSEQFRSQDLTDELRSIITQILNCNCDVIAVNQASPAQAELGLHVYKVLVPGAVPISWGQHRRRITGLSRLRQAVGLEPIENAPATPALSSAINWAPHPFL